MGVHEDRRPARVWRALRGHVRRHAVWWLIGLLALAGVLAIALGVWRASNTSRWRDDLWLEVAKAGVQVVAVGVVGGALAAAWKSIERRREDAAKGAERRSERNDKIRAELAGLVALYNDVKAVRRTLRSLGLDVKVYVDAKKDKDKEEGRCTTEQDLNAWGARVGSSVLLTKEQARGFHEQMQILNTLQLGFESKYRQFEQVDLLDGGDRATVVKSLRCIEKYLNKLLDRWEKSGWTIREGTRLDVVSNALQPLYRQAQFNPKFGDRVDHITQCINKHLFRAPSESDRTPT